MRNLAHHLGVPFIILNVQAGEKTLHRRILEREAGQSDASEAGIPVLDYQMRSIQTLDISEQQNQILVNTDAELNYLRIADDINVKVQQLAHNQDQPAGARG